MNAMKQFELGDILSVTTHHLVSRNHMKGVYEILNFMTNDTLYLNQLPRAATECEPYLREQFPQFSNIVVPKLNENTWLSWLETQEAAFGRYHDVRAIHAEDHEKIDVVSEVIRIRGDNPAEIISIDLDSI